MTTSLVKSLSELPEYTQVLVNLVSRDLKVKYQTKALGFVWSLLDPAFMLLILYVIFSQVAKFDIDQYWAFLIASVIPFRFFIGAVSDAAGSIRRNANIIRKVYVPMEILVMAAVVVRLVEFFLHLLLVVVLLWALHRGTVHQFDLVKTMTVLPPAVLVTGLTVLGLALPLAAWSVIYRDLDHIISVVTTAMLYATPVFWSLTLLDPPDRWWRPLFALNPALNIIDLYRGPMYWGTWPINEALGGGSMVAWTVAGAWAAISLVAGLVLFDRSKRILAEVV